MNLYIVYIIILIFFYNVGKNLITLTAYAALPNRNRLLCTTWSSYLSCIHPNAFWIVPSLSPLTTYSFPSLWFSVSDSQEQHDSSKPLVPITNPLLTYGLCGTWEYALSVLLKAFQRITECISFNMEKRKRKDWLQEVRNRWKTTCVVYSKELHGKPERTIYYDTWNFRYNPYIYNIIKYHTKFSLPLRI